MGESVTALFSSANILTLCLWIMGFALFSIEMFQPMRRISYLMGLAMLTAAFITHMIHGTTGEAFFFILFTAIAIFAVHIMSLAVQKRDWLNVARMTRAGSRSRRLSSLVGAYGVASTSIAFTGNVIVNDINLVVYSETPIAIGERVCISEVTPDRITVVPAGVDENKR